MHARALVVATLMVGAASLARAPSTAAADKDRPLPGFAGLTYRDVALKHGCVEHVRVVKRTRKVDDPELVALLTYPRVTGLDFDPDDPVKQRTSTRRLQEWLQRITDQARKVRDRQGAIIADKTRPALARVEAAARLVQAQQQMVELLAGIEVPPSVRKLPEAEEAFCDAMDAQIQPVERMADEVRTYCRQLVVDTKVGTGWWTDVCAERPGAATAGAVPPMPPEPPRPPKP